MPNPFAYAIDVATGGSPTPADSPVRLLGTAVATGCTLIVAAMAGFVWLQGPAVAVESPGVAAPSVTKEAPATFERVYPDDALFTIGSSDAGLLIVGTCDADGQAWITQIDPATPVSGPMDRSGQSYRVFDGITTDDLTLTPWAVSFCRGDLA